MHEPPKGKGPREVPDARIVTLSRIRGGGGGGVGWGGWGVVGGGWGGGGGAVFGCLGGLVGLLTQSFSNCLLDCRTSGGRFSANSNKDSDLTHSLNKTQEKGLCYAYINIRDVSSAGQGGKEFFPF